MTEPRLTGSGSRRKGATAEREVAAILNTAGFTCRRDGRLDTDLDHDCHGYHFEIKRRERLDLPGWTRQAENEALGRIPIVVYRSSREPWRASLPFSELVRLLALERAVSPNLEVDPEGATHTQPGPSLNVLSSPGEMEGTA